MRKRDDAALPLSVAARECGPKVSLLAGYELRHLLASYVTRVMHTARLGLRFPSGI